MKNYTITVNGNVYDVTVEEGATGGWETTGGERDGSGCVWGAQPLRKTPSASAKSGSQGCRRGRSSEN